MSPAVTQATLVYITLPETVASVDDVATARLARLSTRRRTLYRNSIAIERTTTRLILRSEIRRSGRILYATWDLRVNPSRGLPTA
jgi:hypothetical protein